MYASQKKSFVEQNLTTAFKKAWEFKIKIEGPLPPPNDFELFVADFTHSPTAYKERTIQLPTMHYNFPDHREHVDFTLTMRDTQEEIVASWVDQCTTLMMNANGTVNLPKDYLFHLKRFRWRGEAYESAGDWKVWFKERGEVTESYREQGFMEFPVTLTQFRS